MASKRPPDFTLVLAMALHEGHGLAGEKQPPHLAADEVAITLNREFGFDFTAQQVGSWLRRLTKKDLPPIESSDEGGYHLYWITQWGRNEIDNKTKGLQRLMDWMYVPPEGFELRVKGTPTQHEETP
jgi:hypothetical protein